MHHEEMELERLTGKRTENFSGDWVVGVVGDGRGEWELWANRRGEHR